MLETHLSTCSDGFWHFLQPFGASLLRSAPSPQPRKQPHPQSLTVPDTPAGGRPGTFSRGVCPPEGGAPASGTGGSVCSAFLLMPIAPTSPLLRQQVGCRSQRYQRYNEESSKELHRLQAGKS